MINGVRGTVGFSEAERLCNMLVSLGRAIPADRWVPALIGRHGQDQTVAWLNSMI